jgi:hypothetical protein
MAPKAAARLELLLNKPDPGCFSKLSKIFFQGATTFSITTLSVMAFSITTN